MCTVHVYVLTMRKFETVRENRRRAMTMKIVFYQRGDRDEAGGSGSNF